MLRKFVNLPFKVIGKAARAVQDRNDAKMKAEHGTGTEGDDWSALDNVPEWDTPDEYTVTGVFVKPRDLRRELGEKEITLVDVRHPRDFIGGSIEGADNLPLATLSIRLAELPHDEKIVLICGDGKDSKEATRFLRFRGIEHAWYLQGGLRAWTRDGGTLST